jgi:hypothetical protein
VNDSLNTIPPKDVGQALKELIKKIMISLGKTAGYFFIRETREKIGTEYDTFLLKTMDVDLTLLQSTLIVENKSINVLEIQKSDVIRRFLKVLLEAVEKQTSKSFAIACLQQHIEKLRQSYPFLDSVLVNDIRYTLGPENLIVHQEINTIEPQELGRALTSILQEIDKTLTDLGRNSIASDLRAHLTFEYLAKLNEMSVTITSQGIGNNAVFTQVIKTLIDTIGKSSSEDYAIFVINSFLRKIDTKYEFLKLINVETAVNKGELYHIVIGGNLDTISETDARRSIQLLLESIIRSLGKISDEFVQEFKNSLDKKYLLKIEEIGINFHMIELHEAMSPKIE